MNAGLKVAGGIVAGALSVTAAQAQIAVEYEADAVHSQVGFRVRHLGISWVRGEFNDFSVRFAFDPVDVGESWVHADVLSASIDTDHERRDRHLRSEDFLLAEQYPSITFESRSVRKVGEGRFDIDGDLTIRDTTRSVTLHARLEGETVAEGRPVIAWTAETVIDRREFGLVWNSITEAGGLLVGDDVHIELAVEAYGPNPDET